MTAAKNNEPQKTPEDLLKKSAPVSAGAAWKIDPLAVSDALLEKYSTTGPRYTSYPTAPVWRESYNVKAHVDILKQNSDEASVNHPLALYAHLPFCEERCLFCGCNVVITKQKDQSIKYLDYLFREIELTAKHVNLKRPVVQLHWGGGTPTYLSPDQMIRLFQFQKEIFNFRADAEIALEVDPRVTTFEQVDVLSTLGFNRISLGVQDFEEKVQASVHRIQPVEMTETFVDYCRGKGFSGINFDLIYGLPHQTVATFTKTLETVIRLSPDRIALYNFAYVPWMSPHQKLLPEEAMPDGKTKFAIFKLALEMLSDAGYLYIGMDHFAKPQDELSQALENGTLYRNFMGYTVKNKSSQEPDADLIGNGVSAISGLSQAFAQNVKKLSEYYDALKDRKLPIHRGYQLSNDDQLRKQVILDILCQGEVNFSSFESRFEIDFQQYFSTALEPLQAMEKDGLLELTGQGFRLLPLGRVFSRNIAMPFDAYLQAQREAQNGENAARFSKTL